jgi:PAS domain S-box-containing protein
VRLNELSSRLWRARSLHEGLEEMLAASLELVGADMGHVRLLDPARGVLVMAVHRGFQPDFIAAIHEVPLGNTSAAARALASGERCIIDDIDADPAYAPLRARARAAGFRAVQSTPLVAHDGQVVGILSTHFSTPHRPEEEELQKLDLYARQACDFIERWRAEDALRASEERYRAVVENQSEMVCRFRRDGTVVFANNAYASALGTTPEALSDGNFWHHIPGTDHAYVKQILDRLTPDCPVVHIENRFTSRQGERWTLWTNRALGFDYQGWLEAQSTGIDITERKRFEEALDTNARRIAALYELTDRLQRAASFQDVYETAIDAILRALGCERASILLFDDAGVMRFVAWRGLSETYRGAVEGHSPWRAEESNPRPFGIEDLAAADLAESLREAIRREQIGALAFIPVLGEGRLIGKFMAYYAQPHRFSEDELEAALMIGHQVGFAVQRRRTEMERRRAEVSLQVRARQQHAVARLGELALRERDLQRVLDAATAMVAETLETEYAKLLELQPGGGEFVLRAGHGWRGLEAGRSRLAADRDSQAGYTLLSDVPVVVRDLRTEGRFSGPSVLHEHGVVSGMSCIVRGSGGAPWGVLGAHARREIPFTDDDVAFLVAVANILGEAILRHHAEKALQEDDRRKDEFLATLSHELRNPLAPLRNALHLVRQENGAGPLHQMMERQVNHLIRLVDDLLEMSRISRGAFDLRKERIDLATVVRNAVETSEPLIARARHRLQIALPEEPLWLDGDPVRLAQILSNLLNNAAKYTHDGGDIAVSARQENESVLIAVRDSGIGFAADAQAGLFQMFGRGERRLSQHDSGLGIGLSLARRLAGMHGGSIEARSEGPGKGSEFTVRLPLATDQQPASESAAPVAASLTPKRILVVDDNRDAADSLGMLLQMLGAEVRIARDGNEALATFSAYEPTVVLLDIGMPGMDGYEVARRIRSGFPDRHTALIALTGWGQEEDRRRAREAGFDHHLIKPADMEALQVLLASL